MINIICDFMLIEYDYSSYLMFLQATQRALKDVNVLPSSAEVKEDSELADALNSLSLSKDTQALKTTKNKTADDSNEGKVDTKCVNVNEKASSSHGKVPRKTPNCFIADVKPSVVDLACEKVPMQPSSQHLDARPKSCFVKCSVEDINMYNWNNVLGNFT